MSKSKNNNKNFEEGFTRDKKEIIDDLTTRIEKGEFISKAFDISEISEEADEIETIEETYEEYDFQNDIIEGFDMKKFNEEFDNSKNKNENRHFKQEFIDDIEGLDNILKEKEKYSDVIDEVFPGLIKLKDENQENQ
ncbi:hypothetical protein [Clostridium sp. DL1XJH146]